MRRYHHSMGYRALDLTGSLSLALGLPPDNTRFMAALYEIDPPFSILEITDNGRCLWQRTISNTLIRAIYWISDPAWNYGGGPDIKRLLSEGAALVRVQLAA